MPNVRNVPLDVLNRTVFESHNLRTVIMSPILTRITTRITTSLTLATARRRRSGRMLWSNPHGNAKVGTAPYSEPVARLERTSPHAKKASLGTAHRRPHR